MGKHCSTNIYLDTRREKKNGKYPLKLRVYANQLKKQQLYSIIFEKEDKSSEDEIIDVEYTKTEFRNFWEAVKPRGKNKEIRLIFEKYEQRAIKVASKIVPFSFSQFEKKMHLKSGEGEDVFFQYKEKINSDKKKGRIGNAISYECSLKSIKGYIEHRTGKEPKKIKFIEINKEWLEDYQNYMINTLDRSYTTVGMYLRSLRAIFKIAIREDIPIGIYPFGEGKYEIPTGDKVKKALTKEQLKKLFEAKPQTPEQEKAKDFWFFSYACNGMNIKDIALMRYENLKDNKYTYYRAKTINTKRKKKTLITIHLNPYILSIIEKYGNENNSPKNFIFSIINNNQTDEIKHNKIKNFTRFINQNLKILAIAEGLPSEISTYWARHSFATMAVRNGQSMEFISEALSHSDIKTTQGYFAGFEDEVKKEFAQNIMNF